jgi:ParB-like chromosome segregation protein Spo0J
MKIEQLPIDTISTEEPFSTLFPMNPKTLEAVTTHMKQHGFDASQPIIVRRKRRSGATMVVDGQTRLRAAQSSGLTKVPAVVMSFKDEETALRYAIHNQRDRRNLTDADLFRCIEAVDKTKQRGGDRKSKESKASSEAVDKGKSSEETAKVVGTSRAKVERARKVIKKADPKIKQAVLDGEKTLHQAYRETKAKEDEAIVSQREGSPKPTQAYPSPDPGKRNSETRAITDEPLLELLVSAYDRIRELKKLSWIGCPKETVTQRLQMLLRLLEE